MDGSEIRAKNRNTRLYGYSLSLALVSVAAGAFFSGKYVTGILIGSIGAGYFIHFNRTIRSREMLARIKDTVK